MHDEDMPVLARMYDRMERDVVYLLTDPDGVQPIWSVEDIGREIESKHPMDAIRGILRAGLVHRTADGFMFATRAAVRMVQMVGQVV